VALNSMTHLETKGISSDVSRQLKQDVTEGKGLSEAMAKQPTIFSNLYINMVKAGEQSGALVEVLRRMGNHFERFAEVQAKFKSAMIYPAFVCCVGIAISMAVWLVLTFVGEGPLVSACASGVIACFAILWFVVPIFERVNSDARRESAR